MRRFHHEAKRHHKGHKCGPTGKVCFNSYQHAIDRACAILSEPGCEPTQFRAYKCTYCGQHHLTSKD